MPKSTSITIIGAGISGLTLARCLKHRGIQAIICEKDTAQRAMQRHGYGITLWAYRPLLCFLDLSEVDFRQRCAVDGQAGGSSRVGRTVEPGGVMPFRANRQKLERMLGDGLDVRWDHKLLDVRPTVEGEAGGGLQLSFQSGQSIDTDIVIGADGAHSQVRKTIAPTANFKILPFAVYNGKRRIPRTVFDDKYTPFFDDHTTIEHKVGNAHLTLAIDDYGAERVSISYTYSRPAKQDDTLWRSNRPNSGATDIPDALFEEIGGLKGLKEPFGEVFNADLMRNDRLLHWLMRSVLPSKSELDQAADQGITLLADSVHHGPILGTDGANAAIEDAVELAALITGSQSLNLKDYYVGRFDRWATYVEQSEEKLEGMHGSSRSLL